MKIGAGKRKILILAVALLLVGILWFVLERNQVRVVVENRSGQPIALLRVRVGAETLAFEDVQVSAEVKAAFQTKSNDPIIVEVRLTDGTRASGRFRPVTNGMLGEPTRFVVLPQGEIKFRQGNKLLP